MLYVDNQHADRGIYINDVRFLPTILVVVPAGSSFMGCAFHDFPSHSIYNINKFPAIVPFNRDNVNGKASG